MSSSMLRVNDIAENLTAADAYLRQASLIITVGPQMEVCQY
jgi:hypothetical protein